jgi:phage-related protein
MKVHILKGVYDFISDLPENDAAECNHYIGLLKEHGWKLREPYTEHLKGIYYLRPSGKGGEFRLYYDFVKGEAFVVLSIHKKRRTADQDDINLAKKRIVMIKSGNMILC